MINVKRYDIDYAKLVLERLPQPLQDAEHNTWVQRLVGAIVSTYNQLLLFRQSVLYKLTITPQVVYLEKMLNDRYDSALRRIYIRDGIRFNPLYTFLKAENKPAFIKKKSENSPVFIYTDGEAGQFTFDFVVIVPTAVTFNLDEMKSLVNTYKLAGKIYSIQTV